MSFFKQVYEVCVKIPRGRVATYGQIALLAGNARMARQVGWALHQNPQPGVIPCHRVLNRFGRLCEGFAYGGMEVQRALLLAEDVEVNEAGVVDLARFQWDGK